MMRRIPLALLLAAGLVACGGNTDLTARGEVSVALSDGTSTGFLFTEDTRLEHPERGSLGLVTGDCEMARVMADDGTEAWAIFVEIRRGGMVDDQGLSSVGLMQRTDAEVSSGRIEAQLGTTAYTSGAICDVEIPYAVVDGGMVGISAACEIQDVDGNRADTSISLDIIGCTVLE